MSENTPREAAAVVTDDGERLTLSWPEGRPLIVPCTPEVLEGLIETINEARAALRDRNHARPIPCANHRPVQHRDGKPPWCRACGLTAEGTTPKGRRDQS